jgi:hypothetical protein
VIAATAVAGLVAQPEGNQGWCTTVPSLTLTAKDTFGVAGSQYRLGGGEWTTYAGTPVPVDQQGTHQVEFRSTDRRGNVEEPKSAMVKVYTFARTATGAADVVTSHSIGRVD